jgi:hypothetical protein
MAVALDAPDLVSDIIAVDNSPVDAAVRSDFGAYLKGMREIEAAEVDTMSQADKILAPYEEVSTASAADEYILPFVYARPL